MVTRRVKRKKRHTRKRNKKHNKKQNKRKHQSRRKYKRRHRRKTHKGGRKLGSGAYGIVFGDPALPCNDTPDLDYDNIVSKYFKHPSYFANEKNSLDKLKTLLSPELYEELKKYAVLPIGDCTIDCDKLGSPPYDETYGFKDGSMRPLACVPDETEVMMYPKGGTSFYKYIRTPKNNSTFAHYLENLKMVANVGKGVQLSLIHI